MAPRVNNVKYVKDYELEVGFTDGIVATLDFRDRVAGRGGVFKPLQSIEFFKQVGVDKEAGTLVWPNGVDFCPDVLYAEATGRPIAVSGAAAHIG
jgi:Protein of unknown function (DUF2442)